MTKRTCPVWAVLLLGIFTLSLAGSASDPGRGSVALPPSGEAPTVVSSLLSKSVDSPQDSGARDVCLKCHGPFDKLKERTAKFVAPSGETLSPHRYVPHDSTEASALPNCDYCHRAHPEPPTASNLAALPKPNVEWCYSKCHHTRDFTPCKTCHP